MTTPNGNQVFKRIWASRLDPMVNWRGEAMDGFRIRINRRAFRRIGPSASNDRTMRPFKPLQFPLTRPFNSTLTLFEDRLLLAGTTIRYRDICGYARGGESFFYALGVRKSVWMELATLDGRRHNFASTRVRLGVPRTDDLSDVIEAVQTLITRDVLINALLTIDRGRTVPVGNRLQLHTDGLHLLRHLWYPEQWIPWTEVTDRILIGGRWEIYVRASPRPRRFASVHEDEMNGILLPLILDYICPRGGRLSDSDRLWLQRREPPVAHGNPLN